MVRVIQFAATPQTCVADSKYKCAMSQSAHRIPCGASFCIRKNWAPPFGGVTRL
jgi:hypothetical protein